MDKVKTFGAQMRVFHVTQELEELDNSVNEFLAAEPKKKLVSVSDSATTDASGETMGLVRVIAYREKT